MLGECKNREDAKTILSKVPNKDTLTAIAKSLKVHVVKYDRREDIENKLKNQDQKMAWKRPVQKWYYRRYISCDLRFDFSKYLD